MLTVWLPLPSWELLKDRAPLSAWQCPCGLGWAGLRRVGAPPVGSPTGAPRSFSRPEVPAGTRTGLRARAPGRRGSAGWGRAGPGSLKSACLTLAPHSVAETDALVTLEGPCLGVGRVSGQIITGCFAAALVETLPVSITALHPPRRPAPAGASCHHCWPGGCGPRSSAEGETEASQVSSGPTPRESSSFLSRFLELCVRAKAGVSPCSLGRASCHRVGLGLGSQGAGS